jgi:hypothetical protein
MYESINQDILQVKERVRKREKIQGLIKNGEINLKEETERREELKNSLNKEELDVKRLEGLSVKGIILAVLGNKEDRLDKEKGEFIAAKLKFDECCNSIEVIRLEIDEYYRQLRDLGNPHNEYEDLMRRKEQLVMQAKDKNTKEILDLTEKIADIEADMRELKEAIMAGNSVLASLELAASSLESAEGWGTWDMLGGGLISDMAKHSHIDEAVDHIRDAKGKINTFRRELTDVNLSVDVSIDIGSFDKFADFFFDGLFADWNMQSKIRDSAYSVDSAISRVRSIISNLQSNYNNIELELNDTKRNIKEIIESAQ